MKIRKDVNVIITFDDKEYSEEETAILYQQFFECLAKIKGVKIPEYTGKDLKRLEPLKVQMIKGFSLFLKILGFILFLSQTV